MPRTVDINTTLSLTASSLSALYPDSLSGEERLNALGSHILNGLNDGASLDLTTAVASHVTTTLHKDALLRPLDWLVAEIRQLPADATAERYQLLLRPWLWWLSLASNNRVFQNLATSDIVTTIFKAHGFTAFKLSLRLPPLVDAGEAVQKLKALLEDNAPYQARVTFASEESATGWNAPTTAPWFEQALNEASQSQYGAPCGYIGQGGTIPLMNMLSKGFPKAQMMVCGVLGPKSNAHGPNEFLHVPYAKKLTAAVAQVIARFPMQAAG